MATRNAVVERTRDDGVVRVTWAGLLNGDDGAPVDYAAHADRSVQVAGTFGAGGSLRVQGSLDPGPATNWSVLTDPQGNDLNITSSKIELVTEPTSWVRPLVTAGDGSTNLTVTMILRRS